MPCLPRRAVGRMEAARRPSQESHPGTGPGAWQERRSSPQPPDCHVPPPTGLEERKAAKLHVGQPRQPWVGFRLALPWASHFSFLDLSFHICEVRQLD